MHHSKILLSIIFIGFLSACASAQLPTSLGDLKKTAEDLLNDGELSTNDVVAGLKEALVKGAGSSTELASQLDGYYKNPQIKIPFPPDAKNVESKLRQLGMGSQVDQFVETLNRGAEKAAEEAKPILVSAITGMSVEDGWGILKGDNNAATQYLNKTTSNQLTTKFKPIVQKSLASTNATKYYKDLVNQYNRIPFITKVNPDLDDYATELAIKGLFTLIAEEEAKIRKDPLSRTSDLLKKVFSQQD